MRNARNDQRRGRGGGDPGDRNIFQIRLLVAAFPVVEHDAIPGKIVANDSAGHSCRAGGIIDLRHFEREQAGPVIDDFEIEALTRGGAGERSRVARGSILTHDDRTAVGSDLERPPGQVILVEEELDSVLGLTATGVVGGIRDSIAADEDLQEVLAAGKSPPSRDPDSADDLGIEMVCRVEVSPSDEFDAPVLLRGGSAARGASARLDGGVDRPVAGIEELVREVIRRRDADWGAGLLAILFGSLLGLGMPPGLTSN